MLLTRVSYFHVRTIDVTYKLIDVDKYLPLATLHQCSQILALEGIDLTKLKGGDSLADYTKLHTIAYLKLRQHVCNYIDSGIQPFLEETLALEGGYEFYERREGAIAQLIQENAQTIIQSSSEICTIPILLQLEYNPNQVHKDLSA